MRTKNQLLDQYFLAARYNLLEIAALLDRLERAEGEGDFRARALEVALEGLVARRGQEVGLSRAQAVHHVFSDHSEEPVAEALGPGAVGAVPLTSGERGER